MRGSRRSEVIVTRRAKREGVVRKCWKSEWRVGEAKIGLGEGVKEALGGLTGAEGRGLVMLVSSVLFPWWDR